MKKILTVLTTGALLTLSVSACSKTESQADAIENRADEVRDQAETKADAAGNAKALDQMQGSIRALQEEINRRGPAR